MKFLRRFFLVKKYTFFHYLFLIIISTLLFFGIIFFFNQYITGTNESNNQDEDVLQAVSNPLITNLKKVDRYHIEYTDYDGLKKSIRPKGCEGFDDVSPGVTSSMKRLCRRNYIFDTPRTFPNPPFAAWWEEGNRNIFDGFYIGNRNNSRQNELFSFSLDAQNPSWGYRDNEYLEKDANNNPFPLIAPSYGVAKKDMYILNEFERSGQQRIPEPLPILSEFNGKPLMFYYGGVYEINKNDNSAYLLTRLFDSYSYYSKLCTSKAIPTSVYQIETDSESRYIFRNPVVTDIREERCRNCTYDSNLNKDCEQSVKGLDCKRLGIGLNFPEAFEDISNLRNPSNSSTPNNPWFSNKHTCRQFEGSPNSRYEFKPNIDQLVFKGTTQCSLSLNNSCLANDGRRVEVARKLTQSDVTFQGLSTKSSFNCIGFYEGDKCLELIEFGERDSNFWYRRFIGSPIDRFSPREPYLSRNYRENSNSKYLSKTMSCSGSNCQREFNLLFSDRFSPFTTSDGGYITPYFPIWNIDNFLNFKSIDYNNNGNVTVYSSALSSSSLNENATRRGRVLNPAEVDYSFSDDFYSYAIDFDLNSKTFKVYRFFVRTDSTGYEYFIDSTPSISLSGLPSDMINKDNITVTYSSQSRPLDGSSSLNFEDAYEVEFFDILWSDKRNQSNQNSKLFRLSSVRWDIINPSPGELLKLQDTSSSIPQELKNKVILNLKRYPSENSKQSPDNDYYVWVTSDLVYTSDVYKSDCVLGTPNITVTNTSPNSNVTNSWPLPLSQFFGSNPDLISLRVTTTTGQALNCFGIQINAANIVLDNPSSNQDISINANLNNSSLTNYPTYTRIEFKPQNILSPGLNYPIKQINFSIAGKNYRFSQPPTNQIFGTRGWMVSTENYLLVNFSKLGQDFPQDGLNNPLNFKVEKLNSSGNVVATYFFRKRFSDPIELSSRENPSYSRFYWDNLPFKYRICLENNEKLASNINVSNSDYRIIRLNDKCFEFSYLRQVNPQSISISLAGTPLSSSGLKWNGNVFLKDATGNEMVSKGIAIVGSRKMFEGALLHKSGTPFANWPKRLQNSSVSTTFFRNSQTSLNNFQSLSSLSRLAEPQTSNFVLLTSNVNYTESGLTLPASSYINTFTSIPASKKYQIIALSKGRGINLNLTNDFIDGAGKVLLNRYVFVNLDPNIPGRLRLTADCSQPEYSKICQIGFSYSIKGSIIGGVVLNFQNMVNQISNRIIIHEDPDILIHLTKDLRSKKYNLVTNSKVIVRYLD
jgi:hypothetical protein